MIVTVIGSVGATAGPLAIAMGGGPFGDRRARTTSSRVRESVSHESEAPSAE